jgi:hypothetical protein
MLIARREVAVTMLTTGKLPRTLAARLFRPRIEAGGLYPRP